MPKTLSTNKRDGARSWTTGRARSREVSAAVRLQAPEDCRTVRTPSIATGSASQTTTVYTTNSSRHAVRRCQSLYRPISLNSLVRGLILGSQQSWSYWHRSANRDRAKRVLDQVNPVVVECVLNQHGTLGAETPRT